MAKYRVECCGEKGDAGPKRAAENNAETHDNIHHQGRPTAKVKTA
jgi:hypothetical protein